MKFLSNIADFIFPRECHICGCSLSDDNRYVCASCIAKLPRTLYHRVKDNAMERRFMGQFPFEAATGHFFYSRDSDLAVIIQDFKYRKFRGLARNMGAIVAEELLPTGFLSDLDIILPVPMHFMKKAKRGYNQTEEIAKGISKVIGVKVGTNLKAVKGHRTQTSLSLSQRIKNTEGIFAVTNTQELDGKGILLLDDVCTTGATLGTVARLVVDSVANPRIRLLTLGVTF